LRPLNGAATAKTRNPLAGDFAVALAKANLHDNRASRLFRQQKPRLRIETLLQDPYNKLLCPIPKTYFVIAIFKAAERARCRTL
jgi:hypothetical protein